MSSSASWAASLRSPVRRGLRLLGVLGFNHRAIAVVSSRFTYKLPGIPDLYFRAHRCRWIWFLSTSTLDLRPTAHSLLSRSTVFTSYRFCPILWALSLARCGRIIIILVLSKIASADLSLIYRLIVQIALISFILIKYTIVCSIACCILILGTCQVLLGTSSIVDKSIGWWS